MRYVAEAVMIVGRLIVFLAECVFLLLLTSWIWLIPVVALLAAVRALYGR